MRRFTIAAAFSTALLLGACDGDNNNFDPSIVIDTLEIAAPTAGSSLPSAVDITAPGGFILGGRFPEELEDAGEWDLTLRLVNGQLQFVPASKIGIMDVGGLSRAGITDPLNGRTFESVTQAPNSGAFITDRGVPVQLGAVYATRSRLTACGLSAVEAYGKLQPLEVDLAAQRVKFRIHVNARCADQRLEAED